MVCVGVMFGLFLMASVVENGSFITPSHPHSLPL